MLFDYRKDAAKWKTAGIKFTHKPIISIFRPAGATRCTYSCEIWHGQRDSRSVWLYKILCQSVHRDGNAAPKVEIFHISLKSRPPGANRLTDFYSCWGLLYAQLSCISVLHLTWFASQVIELLLRNRTMVIYPEIFCAPCRKNYALDRKMIPTFLMGSMSSITMQSLGKIILCTPAVGAKCVVFCFFL